MFLECILFITEVRERSEEGARQPPGQKGLREPELLS